MVVDSNTFQQFLYTSFFLPQGQTLQKANFRPAKCSQTIKNFHGNISEMFEDDSFTTLTRHPVQHYNIPYFLHSERSVLKNLPYHVILPKLTSNHRKTFTQSLIKPSRGYFSQFQHVKCFLAMRGFAVRIIRSKNLWHFPHGLLFCIQNLVWLHTWLNRLEDMMTSIVMIMMIYKTKLVIHMT